MTTLYLVRHAAAGDRSEFDGPDRRRPLSDRGRRQAEAVRDQLSGAGLKRLVASPFRRCVETFEPLAEALGLEVEEHEALAERASALDALDLAYELRAVPSAFCSHGDVIPDVLDELLRRGTTFEDDLKWQKGSSWVLRWDGDRIATASYLPPPRA